MWPSTRAYRVKSRGVPGVGLTDACEAYPALRHHLTNKQASIALIYELLDSHGGSQMGKVMFVLGYLYETLL